MFGAVNRLNEKPRKYNILIVRRYQHSHTALEVLKLTKSKCREGISHHVIGGKLQVQVKPARTRKELNDFLSNKITNSKNNRPDVVERIEGRFRPLYLDQRRIMCNLQREDSFDGGMMGLNTWRKIYT
jgi:hypothetical protein